MEERNAYTLKLSGLPKGTIQLDLDFIVQDTNAKSCYISRSAKSYVPLPFALLQFDSDDRAHAAYNKSFSIKSWKLYWGIPGLPHCFTCNNLDHQSNKCPQQKSKQPNNFSSLYNKYKPIQYRSNPNYSRPRHSISHYDDPKNRRSNQLPPSCNYSTISVSKSYADFLKNGITKEGSIYDNTSHQPFEILSPSKKTSSSSGSTNNTTSSYSPD